MEQQETTGGYKSLDDLAFEGRNTAYGSHYLKRKYSRYLLVSQLISTFFFLLLFVIPFIWYYFEGTDLNGELYEMAVVEVLPMAPPEKNEFLSPSMPEPPPPEKQPAPVVSDSLTEQDRQKPEETQKEPEENRDSVQKAGEGTGTGAGEQGGTDNTVYTLIDVFPRFPGGDPARLYFLRTHLRYPDLAVQNRIQGVVVLVFIVETDGTVTNVQVAKGIGGGCDDEAVRVTRSMPPWEPGKRGGRPVRVMMRMPIVFKIPGKS